MIRKIAIGLVVAVIATAGSTMSASAFRGGVGRASVSHRSVTVVGRHGVAHRSATVVRRGRAFGRGF